MEMVFTPITVGCGLIWLACVLFYLVRCFQANALVALLMLFLPFIGLYFLFAHWRTTLAPWVFSILTGIGFAFSLIASSGQLPLGGIAGRDGGTTGLGVEGDLAAARMQAVNLEESIASSTTALQQEYARLVQMHESTDPGDAEATAAYHSANQTYQQNQEALRGKQADLAELNRRIERLMRENVSKPKVVMYSTERCGACKMAKRWFEERGIAYMEKDVERNPQYLQEFRAKGGRGVPLIEVNGETCRGFNSQWLSERLGT